MANLGGGPTELQERVRQMAGIRDVVHPAVKLLPAPSGTSQVIFRDRPQEQAEGEIFHQSTLKSAGKKDASSELQSSQHPGLRYSKEQLEEWGYPKYDSNFDDPDWLREQFRKEREDPRENANFFLSPEDPEFWNNAARKPHVKALLETEDHWKSRKNTWLEQYQQVYDANKFRDEVAERLEECSMATRRLVAPVLQSRAVEGHLMQVARQADERGVPFAQLLETAENQRILRDYRNTLDMEGANGADRLFEEMNHRSLQEREKDKQKRKLEGPKTDSSMKELKDALGFAAKYRKDGVFEWEKGHHDEALKAWRLGCESLERIRVPSTHPEEQRALDEVKLALLKNRAQAAIKALSWNEALECADDALRIDDQDHKAWFRKACALEGLGKLEEVENCLEMIDSIAVGRLDRDRLEKETTAKRETVRAILERDEASQQRMFQLGLDEGLFSEERNRATPQVKALQAPAGPPAISHKVAVASVEESNRKRLTRDGAEDLMKALEAAYGEPGFRAQVRKLARDVRDQGEFVCYLNKVALPVQKPILEKWGFEGSDLGVAEMRRAIQDHTMGATPNEKLKRQAEITMRALYGEMYDPVRGQGLRLLDRAPSSAAKKPEAERMKAAAERLQRRLRREDSDSDDDRKKEDKSQLYAHWTGKVASTQSAEEKRARRPQGPAVISQPSLSTAPTEAALTEAGEVQEQPKPSSAQRRKEIWAELSKAQQGNNAEKLRSALDRAAAAGFSAVTLRSAKKALVALGGDVSGL